MFGLASVGLGVGGVGPDSTDREWKYLVDFIVGSYFILNHMGYDNFIKKVFQIIIHVSYKSSIFFHSPLSPLADPNNH